MSSATESQRVVRGSVEPVGGVDQPSVNVLAHSSQHQAEEPSVTASSASMEKVKVILLALDGAFGAGAGILVTLPEVAISGDDGMETVVFLGIGVDDTTIG